MDLNNIFGSIFSYPQLSVLVRFAFIPAIFVVLGFGISLSFRDALRLRRIDQTLVFSFIFGMTFYMLLLLTAGQFGLPINPTSLTIVGLVQFFFSVFLAFRVFREDGFKKVLKRTFSLNFDIVDILFYSIFITLFTYLFLVSVRIYTPAWDYFTFWLIDPKSIYESGSLRVNDLVINQIPYTSYFTLHFVTLYHIFGRIVEQYTSIFSLIYAAFTSFMVYFNFRNSNKYVRLSVLILLISINVIITPYILRSYADIIQSFFATFALVTILLNVKKKHYWLKLVLLAYTLLFLSLIKSSSIFYVLIIASFFILYDFRQIKYFIQNSTKLSTLTFLFSLTPLIIYMISNLFYKEFLYEALMGSYSLENGDFINTAVDIVGDRSIDFILQYLSEIGETLQAQFHLIGYLYIFVSISIFCIFIFLLVKRRDLIFTKFWRLFVVAGVIIALPSLNILNNVLMGSSSSIDRYMYIIIFMIPLLVGEFLQVINQKWLNAIAIMVLLFITASVIDRADYSKYISDLSKPVHDGTYENSNLFPVQLDVRNMTDLYADESRVLVVKYKDSGCIWIPEEKCLTNTDLSSRHIEYFISDDKTGGSFMVSIEDLDTIILSSGAEYILFESSGEYLIDMGYEYQVGDEYYLFKYNGTDQELTYIDSL